MKRASPRRVSQAATIHFPGRKRCPSRRGSRNHHQPKPASERMLIPPHNLPQSAPTRFRTTAPPMRLEVTNPIRKTVSSVIGNTPTVSRPPRTVRPAARTRAKSRLSFNRLAAGKTKARGLGGRVAHRAVSLTYRGSLFRAVFAALEGRALSRPCVSLWQRGGHPPQADRRSKRRPQCSQRKARRIGATPSPVGKPDT